MNEEDLSIRVITNKARKEQAKDSLNESKGKAVELSYNIVANGDHKDYRSTSMNGAEVEIISNHFPDHLNYSTHAIHAYENNAADMELIWNDVEIYVNSKSKAKKEKIIKNVSSNVENIPTKIQATTPVDNKKMILNKVSGRIKSGECLAMIGASGAGKTTLLNFLSKKIATKNLAMKGEYLLNGQPIHTHTFNIISAYVMQDDILEASLTPLETLMFAAKLKLHMSTLQIEEKVRKMIEDLHLLQCQHTRIGSVLQRGVSGGERKRTSVGVELISDPNIIFLDEPTTGLDSYNAYEVIQLLRKLASEGKIIIFTIHQPSSEIYFLLDKICILALGKTVYFGSQEKCFGYFEEMNLPVPIRYNPFEHFMEMTNIVTIEQEKILNLFPQLREIEDKQLRYEEYVNILADSFQEKREKYHDTSTLLRKMTDENIQLLKESKIRKNMFYEVAMLFGRSTVINLRNPNILIFKVLQSCIAALLISILFMKLSRDFSGIQDRNGLLLISMTSTVLSSVTNSLLVLADERKVFTRERANRLYRVSSYFISRSLAEFPVYFIGTSIFSLIVYWSTFLNDTYSYKYYSFSNQYTDIILVLGGTLILGSFAAVSFAFFLGSITENKETLISLNGAITILLFLLSGFFAKAENFAPYLYPFEYLSIFKYTYQALIHIEFTDDQAFNCQNYPTGCTPLAMFLFQEPFYVNFIAIAALLIFFKLIAFTLLYFFAKIKV